MTNQQRSDAQKIVDAVGNQTNPFASHPAEAHVSKGFRDGYQHGIEESYRVAKDAFERLDSDISSRIYIPNGEFSLQVTSDGISDDLRAILTGTAKPAPDSTGESVDLEPAEVTDDQPVGTYLVDRDNDVWERTEVKVAPFDPDLIETPGMGSITRNLAAFKHEAETPMREHGECCDPAPADDLPGEPVEPGDLRAGDKVEFTWGDECITSTLGSVYDGDALCSKVSTPSGYYPNVVWCGRWAGGISDVRLIERAPREDEDPDEALARVLCEVDDNGFEGWDDFTESSQEDYLRMARAAREHIEAERAAKGEQR